MSENKQLTYDDIRLTMHKERACRFPFFDTDPENIRTVIEWILSHYTLIEKEGHVYKKETESASSSGCTLHNIMFDDFIVCNNTVCKYCERVEGLKGKEQLGCNRPDNSGCIRSHLPMD